MEELERETLKNEGGSSNFTLSKQVPIDNRPEKAQAKQKAQILKMSVNDRYVAENYYQSTANDHILYEKDGTISKMKQFDYKIHKFIRKDGSFPRSKSKKSKK